MQKTIDNRLVEPLCEVLADVMELDVVSPASNFFDDLGADSLVMAHFCARLRKRDDLPSVAIKEIYQHQTVDGLAAALGSATVGADAIGTETPPGAAGNDLAAPMDSVSEAPRSVVDPVKTRRYLLCGTFQLFTIVGYALALVFVVSGGYGWVTEESSLGGLYQRSVVFGGALFAGLSIVPILAKWIIVGRWKGEEFPIWSFKYFRFWVVKFLLGLNPMTLFAGSPIYVLYLRALGAKIGRGTVIFSASVPMCSDLLTIGDDAVIRKDSVFNCYRAEAGVIQTGAVSIGARAFVGESTLLDINTRLGDRAQLGHSSSLHSGQSIPAGEHRVGSPAVQLTSVDYRAVAAVNGTKLRRTVFSVAQAMFLVAVSLPLAITVPVFLFELLPSPDLAQGVRSLPFGSWLFFAEAMAASILLLFGLMLLGLTFSFTIPRLLNLAIKPNEVYPLYGAKYAAHRGIARFSNNRLFTNLLGDTSYIMHYLYGLGYDVSFDGQTGANFGLNVKHDNPYHVTVGSGTMAADGLSIINADYSSTSFSVSPVSIASRSFLGNNVAYPAAGKTDENCLHATKVLVPMEGGLRQDVGFLGSPSFEIPRVVQRDRKFDDIKTTDELSRRLKAKNKHNGATIGMFLLSRWLILFGVVVLAWTGTLLYERYGQWTVPLMFAPALLISPLFNSLVEKASTRFQPLKPLYCSMYDLDAWVVERYWKLSWQPALFDGTPMKNIFWRLLGVRIGKRVFDDGCLLIDKTLVSIGDDCTLNAGSVVQPHSQEDGSFKSDHVVIGSGCTLGVGALVHYGVTMGEGSTLAAHAFLMKGTETMPYTDWGGNPASELPNIGRSGPTETAAHWNGSTGNGDSPREPKTNSQHERTVDPMKLDADLGREYWRDVISAGGFTSIPRWTANSVGTLERVVPADLARALDKLASDLDVSKSAVFLAAHHKVLAILTGDPEVVTGVVPPGGDRAVPCRATVEGDSWRALLLEAGRTIEQLEAYRRYPVDDLARELGLGEPLFETVLGLTGSGDIGDDTVLWMGVSEDDDQLKLQLRHRTAVLDAESAVRILGYHLSALERMLENIDDDHLDHSLLSADELQYQLQGLAGPQRDLPDRRLHELFEQAVVEHPDAIAAVQGDTEWTYAELNARANRLARALLQRRVRRETVVAVVTERNLDWMASVLAIFKAGGVYLPIEPHFPADRIAATLSRAECKIVMTELGSTETLYQACESLPGVKGFFVETAYKENHADHDLGITVNPNQLAYIYFTSGSTGQPKGAMCEHAGMLNHLYAKIDDLEIGNGEIVAQIAPQCFDISLWQLVSALLVGGRTLIVEQDTLMDPRRFIETIVKSKVGVMQVVPSYLEVLLSYLDEHPAQMPELHCVSVTGEALTMELVQRWFAAQPNIKLANAYGLTETSDDTNHEVMDRVPARGSVPLGRAVNNVQVRVVDERLSPVPLGAPGEIVFAGVCVGRGYINDPERTKAAFMTDPLDPTQRFYRSGDYGRWRPDGKLEFLGRRDAQVKIRGFRIEIGEIENAMLSLPGIRQGAVIVTERAARTKQLVGFYSGHRHKVDEVRDHLRESLPDYMVPSVIHWQEKLPLSDNGKIHRKTLAALAKDLEVIVDLDLVVPATPAEQRLAGAWAKVVGISPELIGRQDDFFDRGGTSLSAVQLVIALDSDVGLKDVTQNPVLADLALLLDGASDAKPGLLQPMSDVEDSNEGALVCFPYAGGNAVSFHALARQMRGSGISVYAVELPGHDITTAGEPFASLDQVGDQVTAEIVGLGLDRVKLWGHSSGAAFALAAAQKLGHAGVVVERLFLGAQTLGSAAQRRAHMEMLAGQTNREIASRLSADSGYSALGEMDSQQSEHMGAAYRHDCVGAHSYLLSQLEDPPSEKLLAPVTVVVAADDTSVANYSDQNSDWGLFGPIVANYSERYSDWGLFAREVELHTIESGGHYFLRTRPEMAAEVVINRTHNIADEIPIDNSPTSLGSQTLTDDQQAVAVTQGQSTMTASSRPAAAPSSPMTLDVQPGRPPVIRVDSLPNLPTWASDNRERLRDLVNEHGSLLVRGLHLGDPAEVGLLARCLVPNLMQPTEAFASREDFPGGVYSSSAWPANQQMCMHHEASYRLEVPGLMMFACPVAPTEGGGIPLANSARVLDALPNDLVDRFEREGWILTRNYNDDIGLSFAEAFRTESRDEVEQYCRANAIEFEWQPDGGLRTKQHRKAVVRHPVSGERCWFNQIAFLNEWTMNPEVREFLVDLYGEHGLPFNTRFGNGDPIDAETIQLINEVYEANTVCQSLSSGDVLLVDNIRTAHSREPFEGERQVIVAMGEPVSLFTSSWPT